MSMGDSGRFVEILEAHFGPGGGRMHTGVEIGTHRGGLSERLLRKFPALMLFMVDSYCEHDKESDYRKTGDKCSRLSYDQQQEHYKVALRVTSFAGHRRTILKIPSSEAAFRIPCPRLSFAFLDGSHSLPDVRHDCLIWWPRVEAGGIMGGHDYGHPRYGGVEVAVKEFAAREQVEIRTAGSCWWAVKPDTLVAAADSGSLPSLDMGVQTINVDSGDVDDFD